MAYIGLGLVVDRQRRREHRVSCVCTITELVANIDCSAFGDGPSGNEYL